MSPGHSHSLTPPSSMELPPQLSHHQICHPAGTPLQRCLPFWAPINTTLLRFRILIALATVMHMVAAVIACPLILSFLISFLLFTQLGLISIQSCLLQSKLKTWLYILLQQLPNLLKALERAYLMSSFSCPHSLLNSLQVSFPSHHSITIAFSRSPVGSTGPNPLVNSQATYTPLPSGWHHLTATSQLSYILPPLSTSFHLCPQSNTLNTTWILKTPSKFIPLAMSFCLNSSHIST